MNKTATIFAILFIISVAAGTGHVLKLQNKINDLETNEEIYEKKITEILEKIQTSQEKIEIYKKQLKESDLKLQELDSKKKQLENKNQQLKSKLNEKQIEIRSLNVDALINQFDLSFPADSSSGE